ncbi:MAG: protein phosphatase 2C domain-containing protein [Endomicrobium sp.]|jgi:protein phosphatase|nr:protein phosphatase 2C domain-containing protein [Endomicrobium sp.]
MKILYSAKTDVGMVRTENQDAYGIDIVKDFFVVCDGMGGGAVGDFASRSAVEVILKSFVMLDKWQIKTITGNKLKGIDADIFRSIASIMLANRYLNNLTLKYPKLLGMGTTVVAARFEVETSLLHVYHTGDSRLYRIRDGVIDLLTKDHSKVNELIDAGKMQENEVATTEIQSMIIRALGTGSTVRVDYRAYFAKPEDFYIMCSDGLNSEISDAVIKNVVETNKDNLSTIVAELIRAANSAGGKDNTTVIALKVEDDGQLFAGPHNYVSNNYGGNVVTISDSGSEQYLFEDRLLSKFSKCFNIKVPKSAKAIRVFTNPVFISFLIVAIVFCVILTFSYYGKEVEKDFSKLTGNISGLKLDVRRVRSERVDLIMSAADRISRLELLQETIKQKNKYTSPLPNVQILIEEKTGLNKFVGISGESPLEIKLPKGDYTMTLSYSGYKMLDGDYNLVNSVNLVLELSEKLKFETVIMLQEKAKE